MTPRKSHKQKKGKMVTEKGWAVISDEQISTFEKSRKWARYARDHRYFMDGEPRVVKAELRYKLK